MLGFLGIYIGTSGSKHSVSWKHTYVIDINAYNLMELDLPTRAHPVVSAEHQRPGGGWFPPPPTISKTTQVREKRKTAFGRLGKALQKTFW